jgi:hypothetical protein
MQLVMLSKEEITNMWPILGPLYDASCKGNEVGESEMTALDIYLLAQTDMCVIFAFIEGNELMLTLAVQFHEVGNQKGVDIIGMAGRNLMKCKAAHWDKILDWFRANDVKFVNAYTNDRLAKLFLKKFGFDKSCSYVRMTL